MLLFGPRLHFGPELLERLAGRTLAEGDGRIGAQHGRGFGSAESRSAVLYRLLPQQAMDQYGELRTENPHFDSKLNFAVRWQDRVIQI